ncbi:hypothetical protein [Nonomuraea diastatica]|uniref:Uncharacterized protein n=1 Tax=Nonomuraea diastatica TaxID=1848329 RepID=A0A4R4VLJ6_9ACTN|nr:hypothetical protein [Nonomuraea diastatica]TDD04787.1 hypothetical protein E1294_49915 [Nonomuraea diastatica]
MSRGDNVEDNPDVRAYADANRDDMYRLLTGADPTSIKEMVRILGGPALVAPIVGRAKRTVERWVTDATQKIAKPRGDALRRLQQAAHHARTTRTGRQRALDTRRSILIRNHGARLIGTTTAGPVASGRGYTRRRYYPEPGMHVDIDTMDDTLDVYLQLGEEEAYERFCTGFGDAYEPTGHAPGEVDWIFTDLSGLDLGPDLTE